MLLRARVCSTVSPTTPPPREYHSTTHQGILPKPFTKHPSRTWLWGQWAHRWRSNDSGPPEVCPLMQELHRQTPEAKWNGQVQSKDARRQAVISDPGWVVDLVCWESRKGWQPVKTDKSGKTSCRRQADQCWKVITDVNHFSDTPLKGASSKRKRGIQVPYALGLNQGWEIQLVLWNLIPSALL